MYILHIHLYKTSLINIHLSFIVSMYFPFIVVLHDTFKANINLYVELLLLILYNNVQH